MGRRPGPVINLIIIREKVFIIHYDTIHDFSVWSTTGLNPAEINLIQSHTGTIVFNYFPHIFFGPKTFLNKKPHMYSLDSVQRY